jgi:hypothetical protein
VADDVTLKEHLEARLTALSDRLTAAQLAAVQMAAANEKTLDVAREELTHWKYSHNDWQKQMKEQQSSFLGREEFYRGQSDVNKRLAAVEKAEYILIGMFMLINALGVLAVKIWK